MLLYRLALTLLSPLLAARLAWPVVRGRERPADLAERLGLGPTHAGTGPLLWLHGASNGELTAARSLVAALFAAHPQLRMLVTANTTTGRALARSWGMARLEARLAPFDLRPCLASFLSRARPMGLVILENELWPNRMAMMRRRGLPVAIVSARLSARSARRWARLPGFVGRLLSGVALVSAQTAESAERFRALGLPEAVLAPPVMLKASVALPPADPAGLEALRPFFARADTILAASTHAGEEEQVIAAFHAARARRPALKLILAPRHPARGDEVAALLDAGGLAHARRSAGAPPDPAAPVYLADTLGEMPLWYTLAGACFVGGSLVAKGGHTPYEPAQFDCAILHGPDLANFAEAYARLGAAGAAIAVADAEELGAALAGLTPERMADLAARARTALHDAEAARAEADLLQRLERALGLRPAG